MIELKDLIVFCGIQTLGLIFILLQKKYRSLPNFLLVMVLVNLFVHYTYYFFFYNKVFSATSNWAYSIILPGIIAPPIIYFYTLSILHGKIRFTRKSWLHLIPLALISIVYWIYTKCSDYEREILLYWVKNCSIALYLFYPIISFISISKFYRLKGVGFKLFQFDKGRVSMVKLLLGMMVLHFLILIIKNNIHFFVSNAQLLMNTINLWFFIALSYAISYTVISEPKTINHKPTEAGLKSFKKYKNSKLSHDRALHELTRLNQLMTSQKPFLNPDFDLAKLAELSGMPAANISEILNGLVKQTFNDYTNNYRIEEFKKLASDINKRNLTILALAFESGFNSKSTFNAAFKKFTGTTPSEYIKTLKAV
ncbi:MULTISPECIES: helix-turn-helix domain-containing protein [unclassified Carboxylicivirga]|uniref:helix-turn-helix domain-containing protein n=1 Tax=Carboxylicivirga TaxID=1628153 RepID=UPI003D33E4BB